MSNDNTITGLTEFSDAGPTQDYVGPVGEMTGAGDFTAAALFYIRDEDSGGGIWSNRDADADGGGWEISKTGNVSQIQVVVRHAVPGNLSVAADLNTGSGGMYLNRWVLVHMEVDGSTLNLYVNGLLVNTAAIPAAVVPSTGQARVGAIGTTPVSSPEDSITVGGVAYTPAAIGALAVSVHYQSCVAAHGMAQSTAATGGGGGDFENRWTAADAVDPANPEGALVFNPAFGYKVLSALPVGRLNWESVGAGPAFDGENTLTLIREPASGAVAPSLIGIKNLEWYSAVAGAA